MKKSLGFLLLIITISFQALSQTGHRIEIEIEGYQENKIILGFHYNGKQLVKDSAHLNSKGTFVFSADEVLQSGVYLIILPPDNTYFEFLVDQEDQHFSIQTTAIKPTENLQFVGSVNNEIFNDYKRFLSKQSENALAIQSAEVNATDKEAKLNTIRASITTYQNNLIIKHPETLAAALVKGVQEIPIPEFQGTEDQVEQQRYDFYKSHYFDQLDLADPRLIRTPFLVQKVDDYFEKLVYRIPDSINFEIDRIIQNAASHPETFRYWVTRFLNYYAEYSNKYVGFDAVYVHIAMTYYCEEENSIDWIDSAQRAKICKDANKFKAILIGNLAPKVRFQSQAGKNLELYDIDAAVTVVYFYKPNCSYCEASIPKANAFYEKYKDKGIKILSVCNKRGDDLPKCWETIDKMQMGDWINVSDPYAQGLSKFKVESFPTIFVLDKDKKIISKGIGSDQLEEVVNMHLSFPTSN